MFKMTGKAADSNPHKWKKKYYEQLDILDKREQEWEQREALLKQAIGRLCIAAQGQDRQLDSNIKQIREAVRNNDAADTLDKLLNRMSDRLIRSDEDDAQSGRNIPDILEQLINHLDVPNRFRPGKKRVLRHLDKATDEQYEAGIERVRAYLQALIDAGAMQGNLPGWLVKLASRFGLDKDKAKVGKDTLHVIAGISSAIDWPETIEHELLNPDTRVDNQQTADDEQLITEFAGLLNQLRYSVYSAQHTESEIEIHRHFLLSFINRIHDNGVHSDILDQLYQRITAARERDELESLSDELAGFLGTNNPLKASGKDIPPPQELMLQLLEQLVIPQEMDDAVQAIRQRLEGEPDEDAWQILLRDMADLLNAIRSHVQKEKQEFENFLHQVTGRLQELDTFLQLQTSSLKQAEESGRRLDQDLNHQMRHIRSDMGAASDLEQLKQVVYKRLDSMMTHIKDHRIAEEARLLQAQQSLESMHTRMNSLEQESDELRNTIREKDRQAQTDTLTRIPNRLAFEQRLNEEMARWQRFGVPLSLAMLDIDYFKRINDEYGHQAGDKALHTIAQLLLQRIRQTDFIARYGGEEFVMLLPGNNEQQALVVVDELRDKIQGSGFHYHGLPVTITMSAGICEFQQEDTAMAVLKRADKALYEAKHNGRNRCVVASALPS